MAREFKTGYKVTGDSSGGVRASQAMRGELDKLNRTVENQTKLGKLASGGIGKYAAGLAGAAAVASSTILGVVAFTKHVAEQGDRVQKLSSQLGVSTEYLSGMGHAAELSGSSLEGLAKGQAKLSRSITDLGDGLSTQLIAFDRLGITYEDLKTLSPEEQFIKVAAAVGSLEDKTLRAATAQQIFGRSGIELIPLFESGEAGMAAMREEAERLGLVMSQDFADASAQFNDNLTRAQGVVTGIKRQVAEGLLPSLSALTEQFVESADSTDTWKQAGEFLGNLVRVLVAGFTVLKEVVIIAAQGIFAGGKIIVDTLQAITEPVLEFSRATGQALAALVRGDFSAAADAFSGLGDRMAEAWNRNAAEIAKTIKDHYTGTLGRVKAAVSDVNDILVKNATISQGAAAGMGELADQTERGGKEAAKAAKEFQSLVDRLDPLTKLQRNFSVEQALLNARIAEGGDDVLYYEGLLIQLQAEYSRAKAEATGWGQAAEDAGQKGIDAAEKAAAAVRKEADDRAKALQKQLDDMETFEKAFNRGIERMDDLGADLWKGWFTGAKSAMDSIKSFFQNWLAEMAHAAITRPILVSITGALGIGGSSGALAGVPGALGSLGGFSGAGGGFSGLISGIGSFFGGNSFGAGLAGLPSWLGGSPVGQFGPNYGIAQGGGLFANAGNFANWQYGLTGILGSLLGDKIFGGQGGLGGGIGSALGLAVAGPLGAILGGLGGGFLGGLFGKERPAVLQASGFDTSRLSNSDNDARFSSLLGGGFLRTRRIEDVAPFLSGLQQFDDQIAQFLDADTLTRASDALKNWNLQLEGEAITMEALLESRFKVILGTLSEDMRTFVQEVSGLEGQVERLALGSAAQKIIDAAPDLFEGRTFREFIAVAEAMQESGEELTTTFQRLANQVVDIANQITLVRGFADSNLVEDYSALVAGQGQTLKDIADGLAVGIRGLRGEFTGSADDLNRLAGLVSQRYQSEIAYLQQVDQILAGISGGFQGLKENINRDLFGDEAFYDQITDQAEQLAADLKTMTDPAKIAATVAEIQRLTGVAYSLLDEEGRKTNGQGFLDFISGVESDAGSALELARDLFVEESQVLRDLVTEMAEEFADPLEIAASAHEDAAAALFQAGITMRSAAADMGSVAGQLISAVREGLRDVASSAGQASISADGVAAAQTGAQSTAATIANAVAGAVVQAGNTAAQTIQSSVGGIVVNVQMPGPSAVRY